MVHCLRDLANKDYSLKPLEHQLYKSPIQLNNQTIEKIIGCIMNDFHKYTALLIGKGLPVLTFERRKDGLCSWWVQIAGQV